MRLYSCRARIFRRLRTLRSSLSRPRRVCFTEPAIAVNPDNPQQVVGVFQDNVHAAYSQDAGHTWQLAENVDPKNYRVSGDVSVSFR